MALHANSSLCRYVMISTQRTRFFSLIVVALGFLLLAPAIASAQDEANVVVDVEAPTGSLSWGATHAEVLRYHEELLEARFREQRSGVRDAVRIDRLRKEMRDQYDEYAATWETLESSRSGYETSAIADELRGNVGIGILTIRDQSGLKYYVFHNDRLVKLIVPVDISSIEWLPFYEYVYELEGEYGPTTSLEEVRDEFGIPTTTSAAWQGEKTTLRAENQSNIYNTYLKVFTDSSWDDVTMGETSARDRSSSSQGVGNIMDRLRSEGAGGSDSNVVDEVLGHETEVHIRLRGDAEEGEATIAPSTGSSAMDDEEQIDDAEQRTRPTRRSRPSRAEEPASDEAEEGSGGGGMTIY